ncbi:MAG: hypothetical protein J7507_12030 [Pseudoxanthomonas sp.]|nr:hypothetical protein [Pseudoxanthomonas sp.]
MGEDWREFLAAHGWRWTAEVDAEFRRRWEAMRAAASPDCRWFDRMPELPRIVAPSP